MADDREAGWRKERGGKGRGEVDAAGVSPAAPVQVAPAGRYGQLPPLLSVAVQAA